MKKISILLALIFCCFPVFARGKISALATQAAKLEGFPFTLEELKDIKDSDSKYIFHVSSGEVSLKNKASNIRLFIMFMDKKTKKNIYTGNADFVFIGENDKTLPQPINIAMNKLCPS